MNASREPVLVRTAAVAVVTVFIHMLVVRGWLPLEADSEQFVAGLVDLVGFALAALWSRQAVTPVAAPNTDALLASAMKQKHEAEWDEKVKAQTLSHNLDNAGPDYPGSRRMQ